MPFQLNPSIPLAAQPARINSPFENLATVVAEQRAQSEISARQAQEEQRRRLMREQAVFQQAVSGLPDFSDDSLDRLVKVAPTFGMQFRDKLIGQRKEAMQAAKQQSEMEAAEAERGLSLLGVAEALGPDGWADIAPIIAKHVPDLAPVLPQQFDPQKIGALRQAGVKAADQLKSEQAALAALWKGEYGPLADSIAQTTDPEERAEKLQALAMAGAPRAMLQALGSNPGAFTMTPAQKSAEQDRAESRAIQREGQQITVRGQDLSAATQRRGQDLSAATQRRGQDLTDARAAKTGGPDGVKLSAAAVEKVAGADTALGSANWIDTNLSRFENSLGPIYGRAQQAKQKTPLADKGYAEFAAEVATLKNAVVKATTGAAMSEPEAQRILQQVPDLTDQPDVFRARLAATKRNLQTIKQKTIEYSGGGAAAPAAAPTETRIGPYVVRVK